MAADPRTSPPNKRLRNPSEHDQEPSAKRQRIVNKANAQAQNTLRRSSRLVADKIQSKDEKRLREAEHTPASLPAESAEPLESVGSASNRLCASAHPPTPRLANPRTHNSAAIDHWRKAGTWPERYSAPDTMSHILGPKGSTRSLRRKRSEQDSLTGSSTSTTMTTTVTGCSDQKPREDKSSAYKHARYETLLSTKGSYMDSFADGVADESKVICSTLLDAKHDGPQDSLFRDDLFEATCRKIRSKNETRIIRDISLLIVPSAETFATYGAKDLDILIESTNEGWNNAVPFTTTRPQPDYSVGFRREAFSQQQLDKLAPFIGDFIAGDQSYFMAAYYMHFPFLTSEVKCGAAALDIADRQNAHSMTLAVRAAVELFRLVKREKDIDRQVLGFSISHNHRTVRIYGHYAVIDGLKTAFYRHPIHTFDITALEGREKWTSYSFTKNVYEIWMPTHFQRLCSAIDELPAGVDFDVAPLQQDTKKEICS